MTERIDVTCPSCRTVNSAKRKDDGFLTLPCSGCKFPLFDMDKYFDIVYGGKAIEPMATRLERAKYCMVGMTIVAIVLFVYMVWVTTAMHYAFQVPMALPHVTHFVVFVLIMFGFPYIISKKVLTLATASV